MSPTHALALGCAMMRDQGQDVELNVAGAVGIGVPQGNVLVVIRAPRHCGMIRPTGRPRGL